MTQYKCLSENQIVFITSDGIGLKKGDSYWYVVSGKLYRITICSGQDFPKGDRQFAKKENAESIRIKK